MSTPISFNGVSYSVPAYNDTGYAQGPGNLSSYLIAIATGTLQQSGGVFSLTADVNFGSNFGLLSKYFTSITANPSTVGVVRLARTDSIGWRNVANGGNLLLAVDGSDNLTYNGNVVLTGSSGGFVSSITGTANQIIASAPTGAVTLSTPQDIATTSSPSFANVSGTTSLKTPILTSISGDLNLRPQANSTSSIELQNAAGSTTVLSVDTTNNRIGIGTTTPNRTLQVAGIIEATGALRSSDSSTFLTSFSNANVNIQIDGGATYHIGDFSTTAAWDITRTAAGNSGDLNFIRTATGGGTITPLSLTNAGAVNLLNPLTVPNGGTGDASLTAYAVLCGGTTSTAAVQSVAGLGSSGQVLTSNGAGTLPTFQAVSGSGTVNAGTSTHLAYYATSSTAVSDASGATISGTYTYSGVNTFAAQDVHSAGIAVTGNTTGAAIDMTQSVAGDLFTVTQNSSANAAAQAYSLYAIPSTGGDAFTNWRTTSLGSFSAGVDNSDGDKFKVTFLANGTVVTPSTGTTSLTIDPLNGGVGLLGTQTNDTAATGFVGEYVESIVSSYANTSATGQYGDVTSISLTAGDWDVSGVVQYTLNTGTGVVDPQIGISVTSGNSATGLVEGKSLAHGAVPSSVANPSIALPCVRFSLSATTTVYLKKNITFGGGQPQALGGIHARRVR